MSIKCAECLNLREDECLDLYCIHSGQVSGESYDYCSQYRNLDDFLNDPKNSLRKIERLPSKDSIDKLTAKEAVI